MQRVGKQQQVLVQHGRRGVIELFAKHGVCDGVPCPVNEQKGRYDGIQGVLDVVAYIDASQTGFQTMGALASDGVVHDYI